MGGGGKPNFIPWVFPGCSAGAAVPTHPALAPGLCGGVDSPEALRPAFLRGTVGAWAGFCRSFPYRRDLAAGGPSIKGLRDAPGWG